MISLALISSTKSGPRGTNLLGRVIVELTSPIQKLATIVVEGTSSIWSHYIYLINVREENEKLKERIESLESHIHQLMEARYENIRLKKLLAFKSNMSPRKFMPAQVIGEDSSIWFKTITINRGSSDGLRAGMAVVATQGVVGQIIETFRKVSKVMLITDINSAVDGRIQRTRSRCILEGAGDNKCLLKYIDIHEDVEIGDLVITSGMSSIFPGGLPLGTVAELKESTEGLFKTAVVNPSVDFDSLQEVLVVIK